MQHGDISNQLPLRALILFEGVLATLPAGAHRALRSSDGDAPLPPRGVLLPTHPACHRGGLGLGLEARSQGGRGQLPSMRGRGGARAGSGSVCPTRTCGACPRRITGRRSWLTCPMWSRCCTLTQVDPSPTVARGCTATTTRSIEVKKCDGLVAPRLKVLLSRSGRRATSISTSTGSRPPFRDRRL